MTGLSPRELQTLILQGESEVLDFKETISSSLKIAKTMVSFANTKGGSLLIGVRDHGAIRGVNNPEEEVYMLELAAEIFSKPEIPISIEQIETAQGKLVLKVEVPEGDEKPYYAKGDDNQWWAYIRIKDQSVLASKTTIEVLKREGADAPLMVEFSTKEQALLEYLRNHSRITLKEFCKMVNISHWRARKMLVNLVRSGLIRVHSYEKTEFYTLS